MANGQTVIYGSKTFVIEDPEAADIARHAATLKGEGRNHEAAIRLHLAMTIETRNEEEG